MSYNRIPEFEPRWYESEDHPGNKMLVINGDIVISENDNHEKNIMAHDEAIMGIWKKFAEFTVNEKVDYIITYLGRYAAEMTMGLASKIPAEKMIYLVCDCNLENKEKIIDAIGHGNSHQISCECHGSETMAQICQKFLETGKIF